MHESSDTPLAGTAIAAFAMPPQAQGAARADSFPVQWTGRQAVVTLPEHIGEVNAGQIREKLLLVINRGATELIVDMTTTVSCDHAAAAALARAYQRATASGTQLRLVVTAPAVRRVLTLNGLDWLIPTYPSLAAATTTATLAVGPVTPRPVGRIPRHRETMTGPAHPEAGP